MQDTFYCFWCWRRLPLSEGYRLVPPNKRKQCIPCFTKTKEARHGLRHRAPPHAPPSR